MVQIGGDDDQGRPRVIKGGDQPERAVAQFRLEAFELGRDEDGDPITTAIVTNETLGDAPGAKGAGTGICPPTRGPSSAAPHARARAGFCWRTGTPRRRKRA